MRISPERVRIARQREGLTVSRFAERAGVTSRTVGSWESEGAPASRVSLLATVLGMPEAYFSPAEIEVVDESRAYFRARRQTPQSLLARACALGSLGTSFYAEVTRLLRVPALALPDPAPTWSPVEAAQALRGAWRLSESVVPNLVQLAEAHGVRVMGLPLGENAVDAYSFWGEDERPYIFLSRSKTPERARFDLAHELGHLMLHRSDISGDAKTDRQLEREADLFAAEFLIPRALVRGVVGPSPSLEAVLELKTATGVSAMAGERAVYDAGRLSEWMHRQMQAALRSRGFANGEPGSALVFERSRVFDVLLDHLRNKGMTPRTWARQIGVRPDDVAAFTLGQALASLAGGENKSDTGKPPSLRLVSTTSAISE